MDSVSRAILMATGATAPAAGQAQFTTPGSHAWTAPAGVTSVCVVAVGAGDSRGGGGLGWKNNIAVTPGSSYTVRVGPYSGARDSYFIDSLTVLGGGALGDTGGTFTGDGGGNGGGGGSGGGAGGGGAGGYSGNGGNGGYGSGGAGSGGAGGGGCNFGGLGENGGRGGGVGLLGEGASGGASTSGSQASGYGRPGSGGQDGTTGGAYGGGGGSGSENVPANGAVRIIWGAGRAFPSTNTGDV